MEFFIVHIEVWGELEGMWREGVIRGGVERRCSTRRDHGGRVRYEEGLWRGYGTKRGGETVWYEDEVVPDHILTQSLLLLACCQK